MLSIISTGLVFGRDFRRALPTRTANSIVNLLLGALPLKAEIERRQLGLFYLVIKSENSTLQQLWKRQFILLNSDTSYPALDNRGALRTR